MSPAPATTAYAVKVPFLPEPEWERARAEWSGADATGRIEADTYEEYLGSFESMLDAHARVNGERPAIVPVDVAGMLEWFAAGEDRDGASALDRLAYADYRALEGDTVVAWPPGRNDACWCGSGAKYKRCCSQRATLAERERHEHVLGFDRELVNILLDTAEELELDPEYDAEMHIEVEAYRATVAALHAGLEPAHVERSVRELGVALRGPGADAARVTCVEVLASAMSAAGEHERALRLGNEVVEETRALVDAGRDALADDLAIRCASLGSYAVAGGDLDAAAAFFEAARSEFPESLFIWELAADAYEGEDELELAFTWATDGLELALGRTPSEERAVRDLAVQRVRIRRAQGTFTEPDELDSRVIELDPEFAGHPLVTGAGPGAPPA